MQRDLKFNQIDGGITAVDGFLASGVASGIKKKAQLDLAIIYADKPCTVAGLFTKNSFCAAPLLLNKKHLKKGNGRAIIVNSGNANAYTGKQGMADAKAMAVETALILNIPTESVYVASTGVISEALPIKKILTALPSLSSSLSKEGGKRAAEAIITTDTFLKETAFEGKIGQRTVRIGGIAKGSGMIHPNMATMLAFLTSNVAMDKGLLQEALSEAVDASFHRITIDGDTSTNDMVLLFANGEKKYTIKTKGLLYRRFVALLKITCLSLAKMLVKDGEGATKMVEISISGAKNDKSADAIGFSIAKSLLVKTAFFGEDANWGRIVAAIGNSGIKVSPSEIDLYFGPIQLVSKGVYLGKAVEKEVTAYLKNKELLLRLSLQSGLGKALIWTTDLSLDYVKINALYRT